MSGRVEEARERIASLPADVQEQVDVLRKRLSGLPAELPDDIAELRERFTPEEVRKLADQYYRQLVDLYSDLADRGSETVERLRGNPSFEERFEQVETVYSDVVTRAEDIFGRVGLLTKPNAGTEVDADVDPIVDAEILAVTDETTPATAAVKKAAPKKAPIKKVTPPRRDLPTE